jgi:ERCC4-related helicase
MEYLADGLEKHCEEAKVQMLRKDGPSPKKVCEGLNEKKDGQELQAESLPQKEPLKTLTTAELTDGPGPTGGEGQQVTSATQPCPLPSPSVPTRSQEQTDGPGPTGGAGQQVVSATQPCPLPIPSVPTHSQEQTGGPTEDKHVTFLPKAPLTPEERYKISEKFKLRNYQEELAQDGLDGHNCIICAPTGSGKTLISARIISNHLIERKGKGKVVFVVSRVPLTHQQSKHLRSYIPHARVEGVHGRSDGNFHVMMKESDIVVCTHGILAKALRLKTAKMSDISLLVLDECHNLRGYSVYAQLMHAYLIEKRSGAMCPQVVGLTATPGAGKGKRVVMSEVNEHLLNLCALMDAPRGYSIVVKNKEELDQTVFSASIEVLQTSSRTQNDLFLQVVNNFMERVEDQLLVRAALPRNEYSYVIWVQQLQSRVSSLSLSREEHQRYMLSLEYLEAYANTLCVYEDLTAAFALDVLKESTAEFKSSESPHGKALYEKHMYIESVLIEIAKNSSESEHLRQLSEILRWRFAMKPESRAIVFTRTKYHAKCLNKWIKGMKELSIRPDTCVGHNQSSDIVGMTDHQQQDVLKKFEEGRVNVLVATSVLEEGLDVADCNLVIRFLYVKNEISQKQTGGRGRSDDSQHVSVVPKASKSHQRELVNTYKDTLVEEALKVMNGADLNGEVTRRQRSLLADLDQKKKESERSFPPERVKLLCKGCKEFVCCGSDLRLLHDTHFTLSHLGLIAKKVKLLKHEEKGAALHETEGMTKNRQIFCKRCGHHKWGITCDFPRPDLPDIELPVLKSKLLIFCYGSLNEGEIHKSWGKRRFEVQPYLPVHNEDGEELDE